MGTSEVPLLPERVVVLDIAALDAALALDVQPVGTIRYGDAPAYLGDVASEITVVGEDNQPNLEAVLQLTPDLILGSKISSGKLYRQLSQIAPTVLTSGSGREGDWQENFQLFAEALGQPQRAEQLLAEYDRQVTELQQRLEAPDEIEVSVIATARNRIAAYTTGSFSGSVLHDIGFGRNPAQDLFQSYAVRLSQEKLSSLDGDVLFLIYSPHFEGSLVKAAISQDPIWSQLEAVQKDRVCEVPGEVWIAGRSLLAAQEILKDVEDCLL
ncbi:iron-siderophore ABC transporter substrate-binding protein [Romeria aff. gracilis LEGE 07310]|uniref:Iron-siderophore ABC transporter substrate-binding protein n=1 Tax=Vasconcelosia minhoensis LEGE 07310 TaxID=915328 RepID=A0A8J7DK27_9CYAN|nr:iron-siderophore ABC transporter substrate-binding protein [Romeria gracilis]MBE9075861.1 iron-siderophore ABC transporter substrate-binding protein [Romeria aff. gracilis LEGE 07310]